MKRLNPKTILKPSEWCERKFNETGNTDYLEMHNLWKGRGQ